MDTNQTETITPTLKSVLAKGGQTSFNDALER